MSSKQKAPIVQSQCYALCLLDIQKIDINEECRCSLGGVEADKVKGASHTKGRHVMSYIDGYIVAVPRENEAAYRDMARKAAPIFRDLGAVRVVETWGSDIPDGKVTDFKRAVQATADENIVFSWIEYPDKATRDAANEKMMSDPRFKALGDMPFDGKRMIFGGFDVFLDTEKA
jgi:uncharacterized protein YbaA (DUF1428 family)